MNDLTQRQQQFVAAYIKNGGNGTQAAIDAGYSESGASVQAVRLLANASISEAIARHRAKFADRLEISVQRVLTERARLAFFDPRKLLDSTGRPKPLHELDDDTAAAIAGMKVQDKYERAQDGGEGAASTIVEYKLADKAASLTALERHLGMYRDESPNTAPLNITINLAKFGS